MNVTPDNGRTHGEDLHDEPDRRRDETRDDERDRDARLDPAVRIGAAQLAAPSTRRWRRAGRFDSAS